MTLHIQLWLGDCKERLQEIEEGSLDAIVSDPPYDISFMSRSWDAANILKDLTVWTECFRVLEPGGLFKAFSHTRTYHRLFKSLFLVGFQDFKLDAWTYASGFPKSTNVSKQIDKQAGAEREIIGWKRGVGGQNLNDIVNERDTVRETTDEGGKGVGAYGTGAKQVSIDIPVTAPATEMARILEGYGTALKPGWEPIVIARKPG